jgi:hypothetical protein
LNDPATRDGADRKARKVGAHNDTFERGIEVFDTQSQRYESRKEPVCQMNEARCNDERSDLRVQWQPLRALVGCMAPTEILRTILNTCERIVHLEVWPRAHRTMSEPVQSRRFVSIESHPEPGASAMRDSRPEFQRMMERACDVVALSADGIRSRDSRRIATAYAQR